MLPIDYIVIRKLQKFKRIFSRIKNARNGIETGSRFLKSLIKNFLNKK